MRYRYHTIGILGLLLTVWAAWYRWPIALIFAAALTAVWFYFLSAELDTWMAIAQGWSDLYEREVERRTAPAREQP